MDYIAKLQEKPVHIRKRILFLSTFSITAIIAVIWFSFSFLVNSNPDNNNDAISMDGTSTEVSSLSSLGNIFLTVKNAVVAEKQVLQSSLKF